MKRIVLIFSLAVLSAAVWAGSPLNLGLNLRLNMPYSSYENMEDMSFDGSSTMDLVNVVDDSNLGFGFGAFARLNRKKMFLHSEAMLVFSKVGFSAVDATTNQIVSYESKTKRLNIPIYAGYNILDNALLKARVFTGPSLEWDLDGDLSVETNGTEVEGLDNNLELDEFTWLWGVGAGVEVLMFSFDVRYKFDLKGVENVDGFNNSFNQKTNLLEFTLGFKFF